MRRPRRNPIPRRLLLCALVVSAALAAAAPAAAYDPPLRAAEGPRAMILLSNETLAACTRVEEAVEAAGGRVALVFRPSMVVAFLPEGAAAGIAARPEVCRVSYEPVPAASLGPLSRNQNGALALWNDYYMGLGKAKSAGRQPVLQAPPRGYACGMAVPEAYRVRSDKIKGYGAGDLSTSEYMLLDGAASRHRYYHVNFVFPESDGTVDVSTENWTTQMMTDFMTACVSGIEWWFSRYEPARMALVIATTWQVNVAWEPINHNTAFEGTWIGAIMDALGYGGQNYFYKVRNFDNQYLVSADEAWFNTIFVVNSLNDADGRFTDNKFDYSYYGGPFLVMTWDNGPWGNLNTDYLCAHETGHTFYALDEYASSGCTKTETSGYLNTANGNCENGGGTLVECIMRNNNRSEFTNGSVCTYTRNALGWRDTDADGIPDILDHPPIVQFFHTSGPPGCGQYPLRGGYADPLTEPNLNPLSYAPSGSSANENISVNSISAVEFRLNGGAWQPTEPDDGIWDEAEEIFECTVGPLEPITGNIVEARALNSRGLYSALAADTLYFWPCSSWCDNFDDGEVSDWSIVNAGASITLDHTVSQSGGWSLKVTGASNEGQYAMATSPDPVIDFTEPYTIEFWYRWSGFHWDQWVVFGHVRVLVDQPGLPIYYDPNGNWTGLTNLGGAFQNYIPQNTWKQVMISVTPASRQYMVWLDNTLLGTATYSAGLVPSTTLWFMDNPSNTNYQNAWYDGFCIRGYRLASNAPEAEEPGPRGEPSLRGSPNPFCRTTTICFEVAENGPISLEIFSVAGLRVRTLLRDEPVTPGRREFRWDGRDDSDRALPQGTYFARLRTRAGASSSKLVLLE
jgi:hypothetical protein